MKKDFKNVLKTFLGVTLITVFGVNTYQQKEVLYSKIDEQDDLVLSYNLKFNQILENRILNKENLERLEKEALEMSRLAEEVKKSKNQKTTTSAIIQNRNKQLAVDEQAKIERDRIAQLNAQKEAQILADKVAAKLAVTKTTPVKSSRKSRAS